MVIIKDVSDSAYKYGLNPDGTETRIVHWLSNDDEVTGEVAIVGFPYDDSGAERHDYPDELAGAFDVLPTIQIKTVYSSDTVADLVKYAAVKLYYNDDSNVLETNLDFLKGYAQILQGKDKFWHLYGVKVGCESLALYYTPSNGGGYEVIVLDRCPMPLLFEIKPTPAHNAKSSEPLTGWRKAMWILSGGLAQDDESYPEAVKELSHVLVKWDAENGMNVYTGPEINRIARLGMSSSDKIDWQARLHVYREDDQYGEFSLMADRYYRTRDLEQAGRLSDVLSYDSECSCFYL